MYVCMYVNSIFTPSNAQKHTFDLAVRPFCAIASFIDVSFFMYLTSDDAWVFNSCT